MKKINLIVAVLLIFSSLVLAGNKLFVVTTISTYADIAKKIGKDKVEVHYIVQGDQDAHFVRPKPSYAVMLSKADVFVSTGLDLELWVPSLVDMSKNEKIRSGQIGFVAAADGIDLLEKPTVFSRSEGGLHIYGNPHITSSPLNLKIIAENIAIGLEKNDPKNTNFYEANLKKFKDKIDRRLFGDTLVNLMGGGLLTKLANSGHLFEFLTTKAYKGKKLVDYLGGWLKEALPLRNRKIVTYHKNWVYFAKLFGLEIVSNVEPKPGIPPSPKHVEELVGLMRKHHIKVILSANYFSASKVREICSKVGAVPVIVPVYVNGAPGTDDVFKLIDLWISKIDEAFAKVS